MIWPASTHSLTPGAALFFRTAWSSVAVVKPYVLSVTASQFLAPAMAAVQGQGEGQCEGEGRTPGDLACIRVQHALLTASEATSRPLRQRGKAPPVPSRCHGLCRAAAWRARHEVVVHHHKAGVVGACGEDRLVL